MTVDETLDPILIQVTVPLPIPMIFAGFTDPGQIVGWLADGAEVEARVGGRYELRWSGSEPFESRGTVLGLTPDLDLRFSWLGPPPFAALMNGPPPATEVYVRLQESPEGIDITLEHQGWQSGEAWEAARSWHFHFWDERLHGLKDFLLKSAYG
ncbi:Activator of Hsp90 ATPase like protein [mine drainage metagenome]|uniref:Activator of Hsp90 ATPase like protein n=1 Tax=mine drainage metagenome TaxID=410659 RepID=T1B2S7_9ZZZZ